MHNLLCEEPSKIRTKRVVIGLVVLLFFVVFAGRFIIHTHSSSSTPAVTQNTVLPPVMLRISSLNLTAKIESVGKDNEGRMDTPKKVTNTAWYNLGPKPGEIGNAVIAGHLDTPAGKPSIFYKLDTMKKGDTIEVEDAAKNIYTYRVIEISTYPLEKFPIEKVFGSQRTARLNLITCAGYYNKKAKSYSERTVIFSELAHTRRQ